MSEHPWTTATTADVRRNTRRGRKRRLNANCPGMTLEYIEKAKDEYFRGGGKIKRITQNDVARRREQRAVGGNREADELLIASRTRINALGTILKWETS